MGLSRKLGGGTAVSPRAVDIPDHLEYQWSTQAYTMREILTRFRLPCVVQCSGDAGTVLWAHFRFDMRQPLLLHAARTVRKVHARSIQTDSVTGTMEEFGPPLAIPEDYDGWFFPVNKKNPTTLPKHTRVEGVAASEARRFLVTTTLPAYTPRKGPENGPENGPKLLPHEVTIGEVLTKVGVVKGEAGGSGSASPSLLLQRARQSLQCLDESQHEVIIPFSHYALMFDVAENYGKPQGSQLSASANEGVPSRKGSCDAAIGPSATALGPTAASLLPLGVVSTCTIVTAGNACLPRVFRHVLGDPPALTDIFTGMLRCYSVFTEETVMAATMSRTDLASVFEVPKCLELGTDSTARFKIALNAADLKKTNQYNAALCTCEEQAPSYVRAMKTSFTVHPVLTDLDDVDLLLYEKLQPPTPAHVYESASRLSSESDQSDSETGEDDAVESPRSQNHHRQNDRDPSGNGDYVNITSLKSTPQTSQASMDDCGDSVTTDDVDSVSAVESNSPSDCTDAQSCDNASMSDAVEVEANSEFDISWGRLRRARSFTGSISSTNSDSESSTIHSDSQDSEYYTYIKDDDTSSLSQISINTMSSASQDTVVLRQSRVPNTETDGQANMDDDTASEVSSFDEADMDFMFRVPQGTSLSQTFSGSADGEVNVGENGPGSLLGYGSSVSTVGRQTNSVSSHTNPVEGRKQTKDACMYDGAKRLEALLQGTEMETIDSEARKQQKVVIGGRLASATNASENNGTNSYANNLTQPYLEIPRRPRVQSHPDRRTQPHGVSTFSSFHPQSTINPFVHAATGNVQTMSASTSQIHEVHKEGRQRICESDPNFIRGKVEHDSDGHIDLEFVKSLGEKLLAVSKRSPVPKYQRLETERDPLPGIFPKDDQRLLQKGLRQNGSNAANGKQLDGFRQNGSKTSSTSMSMLTENSTNGSNTSVNYAKKAAGENAKPPAVAQSGWNKAPSMQGVLFDGFDLLEEEIV